MLCQAQSMAWFSVPDLTCRIALTQHIHLLWRLVVDCVCSCCAITQTTKLDAGLRLHVPMVECVYCAHLVRRVRELWDVSYYGF